MPDATTSIAIEQQCDRGFDGYLRGPLLRPLELRFNAPATLIGVRLRPGVAFQLSGVPAHSIVDRRIPLIDCAAFRELAALEPVPHTSTEWIAVLQRLLIDRLEGTSLHPIVARALAEIHAEQGCVSVADVAARCEASERNLVRLMRDWIGFSVSGFSWLFNSTSE